MSPAPREPANDEATDELVSIGRVAELSGISVATLRVWERRYGKPVPTRLPSGHRRYRPDQVSFLRLVATALAHGHRPSAVVPQSTEELERLIDSLSPRSDAIDEYVPLLRSFRGADVVRRLRSSARSIGTRRTLRERVAPLLETVGHAWAAGEIDVRHEHHASQHIESFLRSLLTEIEVDTRAHSIVLATLPDERHGLGLLLAAVFVSLGGAQPLLLGVDSPVDEIVEAAVESRAIAVGISVSLASGGPPTDRVLASLRDALPAGTKLLAGGEGARRGRRGPRGIEFLTDLDDLERRVRTLCERRSAS